MSKNGFKYSEGLIKGLNELGSVKLNEYMKDYTSFKTGGAADIIVFPKDNESIPGIMRLSRDENIPLIVMGGGTNLLAGDKGIRGIVLRVSEGNNINGNIKVHNEDIVYADASVKKENFIDFLLQEGFGGMEFMAGIPGCLGGGIMMNAGTDTGTFIDILESIDVIDSSGTSKNLKIDKEMSSYRKFNLEENSIVCGCYFRLNRAGNIDDIKKNIGDILKEREEKHPLSYPSAGSVFKNPPGHSSWQLIADAGLKGKRIGGAMVSEKHTNFIINYDKASSMDVLNLIKLIQEEVSSKFNVVLDTEIRMIGEF
ncbi:UDP-N-acetylmuramate dehydrogenase [Spirochaetota bacterium]